MSPLPPDLQARLPRAQDAVEATATRFQSHLDGAMATRGVTAAEAGGRFAEALEILVGRAPVQLQQPTSFYHLQLPHRPFFERGDHSWIAAIQAAVPAMWRRAGGDARRWQRSRALR